LRKLGDSLRIAQRILMQSENVRRNKRFITQFVRTRTH
jgi:hypothetical protein